MTSDPTESTKRNDKIFIHAGGEDLVPPPSLTIRAAAPTALRPAVCKGNSSCESGISCSHEGNRCSAACRYVHLFMCV